MTKEEQFKNQRSHSFTIVLNESINGIEVLKNTRYVKERLNSDDDVLVLFVAVIKHDADIDQETKQKKTLHYHVVINFNAIYRIGTVINWLMERFPLINENQISIDKCNSIPMQTRYLLHLDEGKEKHHYNIWEVETNDQIKFENYIRLKFVADIQELIECVRNWNYDLENIMMNLANYDRWRKYVIDLINDHRRRY